MEDAREGLCSAEVVLYEYLAQQGAVAANDFGMYCKTHAHMHTLRCELRS